MIKNLLKIAGVLVLSLVFIPTTSFAELAGTGTLLDPYVITTCVELQDIPNDVPNTMYFKLEGTEGEIDCSYTSTLNDNGEEGFYGYDPRDNFAGNLDGNSNTISNLYINRPGEGNVGLFQNLENHANIHDLIISNAEITGQNSVGVLAGSIENVNVTITNVSVEGTEVTGQGNVGGLIGYVDLYDGSVLDTIENVAVSADVNSNGAAGGLLGHLGVFEGAEMSIEEVSVNTNMYNDDYDIGGLIGYVDVEDGGIVTITDSEYGDGIVVINGGGYVGGVAGDVSLYNGHLNLYGVSANLKLGEDTIPSYDVGGMIGYLEQSSFGTLDIHSSESEESSSVVVTTPAAAPIEYIGGVIGYVASQYWDSAGSLILIEDVAVSGTIDSTYDGVGGFIGYYEGRDSSLSINESSSIANVTGDYNVGGVIGYVSGDYITFLNIEDVLIGDSLEAGLHVIEGDMGGIVGSMDMTHGASIYVNDTDVILDGEGQFTSDYDYGVGGMFGVVEQRFRGVMYISDSSVNINFESDDISSFGGLIGSSLLRYDSYLEIDNTNTSGSITIGGVEEETYNIGGFIGLIEAKNSTLTIGTESYNDMDIEATGEYNGAYGVGGFIGGAYAEEAPFTIRIFGGGNSGNISMGSGYDLGGFIGSISGDDDSAGSIDIWGANNSGNILGVSDSVSEVGGFIGYSSGYDLSITESTVDIDDSVVTIDGYEEVGGMVGYLNVYNGGVIEVANSSTKITKADLDEDFYGTYFGGLFGYVYLSESELSVSDFDAEYYMYDEEGDSRGSFSEVGGLIGELDVENHSTATIESSSAIGTLASNSSSLGGLIGSMYSYVESETEQNTVNIVGSSADMPILFADYSAGGLIGDVIMNAGSLELNITDSFATGEIGDSEAIENIQEGYSGGLVGAFIDGFLSGSAEVTISGSYSSSNVSATPTVDGEAYIGGLVGYLGNNASLTIEDSYATGDVASSADGFGVGGLVGEQVGPGTLTINSSYATGNVTGLYYVGGLVGDSNDVLVIDNSYATGDVVGSGSVGGLVGWTSDISLDHSYASGDVTTYSDGSDTSIGGLAGYTEGGDISNSFAIGLVSSTEEVQPNYTNGLIGEYQNGSMTLTNNYYDVLSTDQPHCSGYSGEGEAFNDIIDECVGVNTVETPDTTHFLGEVTANEPFDSGAWDFETVWTTNTAALPTLRTTYYITSAANEGGTISPDGVTAVSSGNDLNFELTPDDGYELTDVIVDSVAIGPVDEYEFENVSESHSIYAVFSSTELTYDLTTHMTGQGEGHILISPDEGTYANGAEVDLTAVADAGSTFKKWTGCSTDTDTEITITMNNDKTCTAVFDESGRSSHHGGGGGGSSSSSSATAAITTNTTPPSDCAGGVLFSASTGKSCSGSASTPTPGCSAGFLFSPLTGAACGSGGTSPATTTVTTPPSLAAGVSTIARTLKMGMTGNDVLALQIYLNTHGFVVAASGAGSAGNESTYFGSNTLNAVKKFQTAKGLTPDGVVGPMTRAKMQ